MERGAWRAALEEGHYELLTPDVKENGVMVKRENGEVEDMEVDYSHLKASAKDR